MDSDTPPETPNEKSQSAREGQALGAGVAIGAGVGTALFAATGNAVWIGVGAAVGVAIGAAIAQSKKDSGGG